MKNDAITVIATSYNDEAIILDYLKSITQQSVLPMEYILVDGGSKDNTVHLAEKFQADTGLPLRVISGKRLNIAEGYNVGVKEAKTDAVVITGVGNRYDRDFLKELVNVYMQGTDKVVYGLVIGQDNGYFSRIYNKVYLNGEKGIKRANPSNRGVLIEKSVFSEIGYFYEQFVYAGEDGEYFLRVKKAGISIGYTPDAKLYWATPTSIKEYIKQRDGYFIGGMQYAGLHKSALITSCAMWLCLLIGIAFCQTPWVYLGAILLYLHKAYKMKTLHPLAVLLNIFGMLLYLYLLIKNRKYLDEKYRAKIS